MKRIICLITVLCLVLGSISFCFAQDWSASDSQNLSNVAGRLYYMNQSAAYYLYNIATNTNNIYNKTADIYNALFNNGHNITYWVQAISTWMSPIYNAVISVPTDLSTIIGALGYFDTNNNYYPYLRKLDNNGWGNSTNSQSLYTSGWDGQVSVYSFTPSDNWQQNLMLMFQFMNNNITQSVAGLNYQLHSDKWGIVSLTDPISLNEVRSSYTSTDHMIEQYLQNIGVSAARLSYVLASPERIDAQEASADNEEAVVDNFIDSNGAGSASVSDIGSISDLSSGYKSNFGSDASVTGIFNIFNSNNMGWFSSETYNQLDTTSNNSRTKSVSMPNTPLLDQKIIDIYNAIGLDNDR